MEDLKILATPRVLAEPMPRAQLIPIITIIQAVSDLSDGEASIPELLDALHGCYDCDTMMMYRGTGYGLADALDGNPWDEYGGFNERKGITTDLFMARYWIESGVTIRHDGSDFDPHEFLMTRVDGLKLAMKFWEFFAPDRTFDCDHFNTLTRKASKPSPVEANPTLRIEQAIAIPSIVVGWPWGSHHTELLGHLEAAARRYWGENYVPSDATTASTNATVSEWLQTERKVSRTMANSIASMLRPDGLPTGPRK